MKQLDPYFESKNEKFSMGWTDMREVLGRILNPGCNTLLICRSGRATLLLNGKRHLFRRNDILHIYADGYMSPVFIRTSEDFSTFCCMMSGEFAKEVSYNVSSPFWDLLTAYPLLRPDRKQAEGIELWLKQMEWLECNIAKDRLYPFVRDYIYYLYQVIDIEAQKKSEEIVLPKMNRAEEIFREFGILLDKYICREHNVAFYAGKLCITPYYLSKVTNEIMNESPKSLIDGQVIMTIKVLLGTTNLPVKAIAEQMNFEDASYLCRYFKRHVGMSLSDYRKKNRY